MDAIPSLKQSDLKNFLPILETIQDSTLLSRFDIDIGARIQDVQDRVKQVSADWYDGNMHEKQSAPGVNRALPLLLMTDEIETGAKGLDKRFPKPILGLVVSLSTFSRRFHLYIADNNICFTGDWTLFRYMWK